MPGLLLLAFAMLALLGGCANGDFGEVRPILVHDGIHDWVGSEAVAGRGVALSDFRLTDDERELRDLAFPLIQPPFDRQRWYSVLEEYGIVRPEQWAPWTRFDRDAYLHKLLAIPYRSPSARYARLIDDIRNDTTRLPEFFETAARVIDMDRKRKKSLAYIHGLSAYERNNALRRVHENRAIVAMVEASLSHRAAAYRFALEHLVVRTPSSQAADAEHDLDILRAGIARYSREAAFVTRRPPNLAAPL
ncbi:MAG TPA: hypothetical protein VFW73_05525 [Lacipirellulaceae bacterium]|nr:hypothetical protein [Lacipirellulaceae bacterium]